MQDFFIQNLQAVGLYTESVQDLIEVLFHRMVENSYIFTVTCIDQSVVCIPSRKCFFFSFLDQ